MMNMPTGLIGRRQRNIGTSYHGDLLTIW
jgi:hypothetical protein